MKILLFVSSCCLRTVLSLAEAKLQPRGTEAEPLLLAMPFQKLIAPAEHLLSVSVWTAWTPQAARGGFSHLFRGLLCAIQRGTRAKLGQHIYFCQYASIYQRLLIKIDLVSRLACVSVCVGNTRQSRSPKHALITEGFVLYSSTRKIISKHLIWDA